MKEGGTISDRGAQHPRPQRHARRIGELAGDFVQIVIADTGEGIDPQGPRPCLRAVLHDQEASRASGLGLSQVHGFAKQLGGTVEISSTIGQGTSVALYLPRADCRLGSAAKPELGRSDRGRGHPKDRRRDPRRRRRGRGRARPSGHARGIGLRGAHGASAQTRRSRRSHARVPSLLLTDVTMPGTMDGVALARQVRQTRPDLPVVLITGNPMVVADSSEFPLLQKPINSRQLDAAIQRLPDVVTDETNVVALFPGVTRALLTVVRSAGTGSRQCSAYRRRPEQGRERSVAASALPDQQLRVPLHPDEECARSRSRSPGRCRSRPARPPCRPLAEPVDGLVVQAFTRQGLQPRMRVEPAAAQDRDRLLRQHRAHPRRLHVDLVDVGVQRAAERHVDHLRAAADAEHRQVWRGGPPPGA